MSEQHAGLLGFISEALEIQQAEGVSADAARAIQRQRAAERLREHEAQQAEAAKDNVVYGIDFRKGRSDP